MKNVLAKFKEAKQKVVESKLKSEQQSNPSSSSSVGVGVGVGVSNNQSNQQLPTETKKNKWVLPVAIGGGILIVGVLAYFILRKKKK